MTPVYSKKLAITAVVMTVFFICAGIAELAEARSRSGGRSFNRSAKPAAPARQAAPNQSTRPDAPGGAFSSPFARGMAGGLMGGMLGGMLFGGMAHGMGMGGIGGSGIGLFEILLLAGLGYFLYRRFSRRQAFSSATGAAPVFGRSSPEVISGSGQDVEAVPSRDLIDGVKEIWTVDNDFNPESVKETAQDLFFKIQAGWTRREAEGLKELVGEQLLNEYAGHFAQMKEQGRINRLENIAVRKVDLVQAGVADGEIFVTVQFTANLLDYTVDEKSNAVVGGDAQNPVKFEELWTFARPVGDTRWKLEGIEH